MGLGGIYAVVAPPVRIEYLTTVMCREGGTATVRVTGPDGAVTEKTVTTHCA